MRTAASANVHTVSPSTSSELTIRASRHRQQIAQRFCNLTSPLPAPVPTGLNEFVGLFTGSAALVTLVFFLPLPATFGNQVIDVEAAVEYSSYVVRAVGDSGTVSAPNGHSKRLKAGAAWCHPISYKESNEFEARLGAGSKDGFRSWLVRREF